jgi:hypothetical protein
MEGEGLACREGRLVRQLAIVKPNGRALAADIGAPEWVEKEFDYDNQPGISVAKILGFLKPQFTTQYSGGTKEDHGVISAYVAQ